jgi:hypothetical protein
LSSLSGRGTAFISRPREHPRHPHKLSAFEKSRLHAHTTIQTTESVLCSHSSPP